MGAGPYREALTFEGWRERFQRGLKSRFGLRLHMTAALALVLGSGVLAARVLRPLTGSMPLRYALAVLIGYAMFFGAMGLWARYLAGALHEEAPEDAMPAMVPQLVSQMGEPVPGASPEPGFAHRAEQTRAGRWADRVQIDAPSNLGDLSSSGGDWGGGGGGSSGGGSGGGGGWSFDADGEGLVAVIVIVLLALVVLVVFGAAVWCVWEAPVILGEVAFELALATALARAARRDEGRGWSHAVLRNTWKPALAVFLIAVIAGAGVQGVCPGVETMHDAVQVCVLAPRAARPAAQ